MNKIYFCDTVIKNGLKASVFAQGKIARKTRIYGKLVQFKYPHPLNLLLKNKFWPCRKAHHDHLLFLNNALTKQE